MNASVNKLADRFSETAIDDEIVVMNLESGDFFSLTGTARAIWLLIDGARSPIELRAALAREYGIGEDDIAADVDTFLAELGSAGLISAG